MAVSVDPPPATREHLVLDGPELVTQHSHMREVRASEVKAKCLAILDEVERTGEPVTILKRGRPVARLVPPELGQSEFPQKVLFGTVEILGDVVEPALTQDRRIVSAGLAQTL